MPEDRAQVDELAPPTTLVPIELQALGEHVYQAIREQIVDGSLRPGAKLSDLRLSAALGVSRTPVREALYRLVQEHVVEVHPRRGFAVAVMRERDVRELYEIRLGLELLAVRFGGPRLTAVALSRIQKAHAQMIPAVRAGTPKATEAFATADRALHQALILATDNQRLQSWRESLQTQLDVLQVYGLRLEELYLISIDHHAAIIEGLIARDWPAAEQAMSHHINEMKRHALAVFADESP